MKLIVHQFDLPLRHVFRISREAIAVQPTLIVELREGSVRGFGEATTNPYYGVTIESMARCLARVQSTIEESAPDDPEGLWRRLHPELRDHPFVLCAVDQAAHDLWGKLQGRAVYDLWELSTEQVPYSNFTIGIDQIDVMVAKLREMPGWPVYKIKLGTEHDLQIIQRLREQTSALFRVDANCGWTAEQTLRNAPQLKEMQVEFIEQPLPADQREAQRQVFDESALPIIADESCIEPNDVARCHGLFHGINIKLVKCGGLTPARRMIDQARDLGLRVMVGCMTESTVGISAIAQLLPLLDYVDMDGAVLLAEDIATGVVVDKGICHFSDTPGTGAQLNRDKPLPLDDAVHFSS
jgi:L-alanine-DL-glutamate epimerase-like enolase superfamily enzyme